MHGKDDIPLYCWPVPKSVSRITASTFRQIPSSTVSFSSCEDVFTPIVFLRHERVVFGEHIHVKTSRLDDVLVHVPCICGLGCRCFGKPLVRLLRQDVWVGNAHLKFRYSPFPGAVDDVLDVLQGSMVVVCRSQARRHCHTLHTNSVQSTQMPC